MIKTSCAKCVFAEWEGSTQINCSLDRLEKFQENGAIITSETESDKTYFMIHGRFCNACTQKAALEGIPKRKWAQEVADRTKVKCNMAIYAGPESSYLDVVDTILSIAKQETPPHEMKVILHGNHNPGDYIAYLSTLDTKILWSVEEVVLEGADYYQAIDLTMEKIGSTYYSIATAGYEYSPAFISTINKAINEDLKRFVAILPDEYGNAALMQRGLHKLIGGNRGGKTTIEKLKEIASEEATQHMIKRFEEL